MTAVTAVLEQLALHTGHALGVEVALQLVGHAELTEHVAPVGSVEVGAGQVRHQQRHLTALEFVGEIEHQPSVASKAGEVVDDDPARPARGHRGQEAWYPSRAAVLPELCPPESEITRAAAPAGSKARHAASCSSSLTSAAAASL
jgi:hypothetical protein